MKTLSWVCGSVWLLALACGGEVAPQAPQSSSSGSAPNAPPAPEEAPPPSGKVAACTTDASCNWDPAVSALWGACDTSTGKCTCREAAELDPVSERCRPAR